ncbi:MAG TPA: 50S ribosomal protein L4 [Candidatus Deferrimicrobium sp.]|nr:50S ribosomal protein L4 [Candidatus Deferrimicrobium sp.]
MQVKVYNQAGQEVGSVELKPGLFEVEPNETIVHQYMVNYLARQRGGHAKTKTRHEVSGGGRKPWRQKGTGRARAGTIRSPLWRGGGTVFGPHPRTYGSKMPKQMKRLAFASIFSDKARGERVKVLDRIELERIRTKEVASMLSSLELADQKCLLLDDGKNDKLVLSCRNLPKLKYSRASLANGFDLVNADWLVFTKAGLEKVQEVFG